MMIEGGKKNGILVDYDRIGGIAKVLLDNEEKSSLMPLNSLKAITEIAPNLENIQLNNELLSNFTCFLYPSSQHR